MKYAKPPRKSTRNKAQRPMETHNLSGEIDLVKSCTQSEMEFFDNLVLRNKCIDLVKPRQMLKRLTWPLSWHVGYASSFFLGRVLI